jgi:hypothetical protein
MKLFVTKYSSLEEEKYLKLERNMNILGLNMRILEKKCYSELYCEASLGNF